MIPTADSHFTGVPYAITVAGGGGPLPNIVIDNLLVDGNTPSVVLVSGGATILEGTTSSPVVIGNWAMGNRYTDLSGVGGSATGYLPSTPSRPASLIDGSGHWFSQSRPLYTTYSSGEFVVATENGVSNKMTGDQSAAINKLLVSNVGKPIFFPAGIYLIGATVNVPVGSIIVGEAWSQFMATATSAFTDPENPGVMIK